MSHPGVRHFLSLKLGGSDEHRIAIAMAAIYAAQRGFRVDDQQYYKGLPTEPDLVISRREKLRDGARIRDVPFRFRVEVVDTHDPIPDGKDKSYDDVLKINISGLTLDEIWKLVQRVIP